MIPSSEGLIEQQFAKFGDLDQVLGRRDDLLAHEPVTLLTPGLAIRSSVIQTRGGSGRRFGKAKSTRHR
jgi:hypothetical protein